MACRDEPRRFKPPDLIGIPLKRQADFRGSTSQLKGKTAAGNAVRGIARAGRRWRWRRRWRQHRIEHST